MKKILVGISVVAVALVIFGAGFFFAQSNLVSASGLPRFGGPGGMMGGRGFQGMGQVHEYVEQALADKLKMTKTEVEAEETKGISLYQIAINKGTKEADVTALLTEVHKTAMTKAVTDGILTQAQADTMLQNMSANGFNYANGPMLGGRGNGNQGMGQIHEYVEQALADTLKMTKVDVEAEETKGLSLYQIAINKGTKEADVTALLTLVHKTALAKAVTDGILTQAQADSMLQTMSANGFNYANGPMMGGERGSRGKGGMMGGRAGKGGMMGGWNQQPAVTPTVAP
ncbi:MAG: hypothetical protein WCK35_18310 [Chloroflexota bacterium]